MQHASSTGSIIFMLRSWDFSLGKNLDAFVMDTNGSKTITKPIICVS